MRSLRYRLVCLLLASALYAPTGHAEAADDGSLLVPRGASYRYQVAVVPTVTSSLGLVALAGLDAAGGRAHNVPSALGTVQLDLGGFPGGELGGKARVGRAPFAGRDAGPCQCRTELVDTRDGRAAVLYATTTFELESLDDVGSLELSVRYRDGIAIFVNGSEVARRNLRTGAMGAAIAARPRGPEWERFYIPASQALLHRGRNLVAVEVRPSGHRGAPVFDLELRALSQARAVRGPVAQRPSDDHLVIRFTTDRPVKAWVEWGMSESLGRRAPSAGGALARQHRAVISGVEQGKPIYYRVHVAGTAGRVNRVAPAPTPGQTVRFAVYGDMRGGHAVHQRIVDSIVRGAPDFVVVTGDLVHRGSDGGDWQRFFAVAGQLLASLPYYPVAGNHDLGRSGDERRLVSEHFELPVPAQRPYWGNWYSFDIADLHFVMLDSNSYQHKAQLDWLQRDLARARRSGVRAIFAATHDGPYSRGIHKGNRYAQEVFAPVLAKGGVAMLFSGHDHMYQRGEIAGLRYVVSGGGGASLYPVRCGVPGRRRCAVADGMKHVERAHHYVQVTVRGRHFEVCARRPDGSALERCVSYPLPKL